MNCHGCRFCDEKALKKGKICCTYAFQLMVDKNGTCLTRRENDKQRNIPQ